MMEGGRVLRWIFLKIHVNRKSSTNPNQPHTHHALSRLLLFRPKKSYIDSYPNRPFDKKAGKAHGSARLPTRLLPRPVLASSLIRDVDRIVHASRMH